jgi:hypothetical protein
MISKTLPEPTRRGRCASLWSAIAILHGRPSWWCGIRWWADPFYTNPPFGQAPAAKRIGYNSGYTVSMKTAVSVPDDLFRLAEAAARRLRVSRSRLYATAIAEFLSRRQENTVTERLNTVYSRRPAKVDPGLHRAQLKSLEKDAW